MPDALPRDGERAPHRASQEFVTFAARTDAQRRAVALIEQGVERLLSDPEGFFRFAARFHRYSLNNQLLILTQFPEATRCASKETWKQVGRSVAADEVRNGMKIFFPLFHFVTRENPDTGEEETRKTLTGFGVGNTYDVSQTEGGPLPQEPAIIEALGVTEGSKAIDRRLSGYLIGESVRLARLPLGTRRGVFIPEQQVIGVNLTLPYGDILTTKTLMHEAAHWAGEHRGGDRRDLEAVAEAAAFVGMQHFGMDTSEYSFPYVAHWAQDMSRLRQNLEAVNTIATKVITGIAGERPEAMGDWL
jgi:hypothetical protein